MKRLLLRRRLLLPYRSLHSNSPRRPISTSQSSISSEAHENSSDHGAHGELYPGVPLYDLVRGWSLYNLFRCDYIVDNSITVRIALIVKFCVTSPSISVESHVTFASDMKCCFLDNEIYGVDHW